MTDARVPDRCAWAARGYWKDAYECADADLAAALAEIARLTKERDREALTREGILQKRINDLLARAEKAEAERDEARAQVVAAFEVAALVCEDYPRSAPDYDEWKLYDEQIEHSQRRIRALTPADAQPAIEAYSREKVREGMQRAANLFKDANHGKHIMDAIFAEMETLK